MNNSLNQPDNIEQQPIVQPFSLTKQEIGENNDQRKMVKLGGNIVGFNDQNELPEEIKDILS